MAWQHLIPILAKVPCLFTKWIALFHCLFIVVDVPFELENNHRVTVCWKINIFWVSVYVRFTIAWKSKFPKWKLIRRTFTIDWKITSGGKKLYSSTLHMNNSQSVTYIYNWNLLSPIKSKLLIEWKWIIVHGTNKTEMDTQYFQHFIGLKKFTILYANVKPPHCSLAGHGELDISHTWYVLSINFFVDIGRGQPRD